MPALEKAEGTNVEIFCTINTEKLEAGIVIGIGDDTKFYLDLESAELMAANLAAATVEVRYRVAYMREQMEKATKQ